MASARVVVTGTTKDGTAFGSQLHGAGFDATALQTIRISKKALSKDSAEALNNLPAYDYLLFTSAHAVEFFAEALRDNWIKKPTDSKVVAVGPATAQALRAIGLRARIVPKQFNARALLARLKRVRGKKILFPCSTRASLETAATLKVAGAFVKTVPLYTTTPIQTNARSFRTIFKKEVRCIIFLSPSGVLGFAKNLHGTILKEHVLQTHALCIGPTTGSAASKAGFRHITIAKSATTEGILQTLRRLS